jgi:membrane-associated phospholipid phosphatase
VRRLSPHGVRDLLVQIGLWVLFGLAYEAVRGIAGDDRAAAFANGRALIRAERAVGAFFEPSLQHLVGRLAALSLAVRATYWLSEFVLLVGALVWVYFTHRRLYSRFRDAVLVANVLGLVGYLLLPTAPPRLFHGAGFLNRLSGQPPPEHASGLIHYAANPYAAMPSVHVADALLIGAFLAAATARPVSKLVWWAWPGWVSFAVLATGNHFWLDVAAGAATGLAGIAASYAVERRRAMRLTAAAAPPRRSAQSARSAGRTCSP